MSMTEEQAAVLALTRATAGPWRHTARVVEARGSALRLVEGDFTGLDEEDRAHAARVRARLRPGDLARAERLIASRPDLHLLTVLDHAYPGNLATTYDLQPFLWTHGRLLESDHRSIAIVAGDADANGIGDADGGAGGPRGAGGGGGRYDEDGSGRAAAVALADAGLTVVCDAGAPAGDAALSASGRTIAVLPHGFPAAGIAAEGITVNRSTAQATARRGITSGAITTDATIAGVIAGDATTAAAIAGDGNAPGAVAGRATASDGIARGGIAPGAVVGGATALGGIAEGGNASGGIPGDGNTPGGIAGGGVGGLARVGLVGVSVFWSGVPVTAGTVGVAQGVVSGMAGVVYVCDPRGGGRAAGALAQGKHVFAPPGMPWVSRVGYRGGVTVVAGIDDLVRQAVNLVDVTRLTTVF